MRYDLLTEPWIPVSTPDGGPVRAVGICDVLLRAHEWSEVQCASPLATVAILRMLLAILHRACPPEDVDAWAEMWKARQLPEGPIRVYLSRLADRFDLFHPDRPFLQVGGMRMSQAGTIAQLATEAATGNNPTLFDHSCDDAPAALSPAEAARRLLAAQSFALGFGKAAEAEVNGKVWPRPYLADAICLRGVTLFLSGDTLFETLLLNLLSGSPPADALPIWEQEDPLELLDKVVDGKRVSRPQRGFVERYAWPSRMIRFVPEPDGTVRRAYFTQGREADKKPGDPMKVFVQSKEEGVYALGLNSDKATWRDLHSYLGALGATPPGVIRHAAMLVNDGVLPPVALYRINVVGLATDPGKAGKFLLWRHDRMSIPAVLLADEERIGNLVTALRDVEFVAADLRRRFKTVIERFLPPEGNPDPKDVDALLSALDPRRMFWPRMEPHFVRFLMRLPETTEDAVKEWRKRIEQEAAGALRASCARLGESVRALRATAQVSFQFTADSAEVKERIQNAKQKKQQKRKEAKANDQRDQHD